MATDKTLLLFAALDRDLHTVLRHAAPDTIAQMLRALRCSPPEIAALEALRADAARLAREDFEARRKRMLVENPAGDPFQRLRRARRHRSRGEQARERESLAALVANRRVVVVGPSRSIVGSAQGAAIEAYDVVVRLNFQWPVAPALAADLGARMDVLYHCCNGDFPVADLFVPAFARTRVACWQAHAESFWLEAHCLENGIPSLDVSALYQELEDRLGTPPFTGTVAIEHLRRFDVAELYLTGISFLAEPYYPGYRGHGASAAPGTAIHDAEPQLRYFREVIARDERVRLDPLLERLRTAAEQR